MSAASPRLYLKRVLGEEELTTSLCLPHSTMKAIITKQNLDGSFDQVGMNSRVLVSHLKTEKGIRKWAKEYAKGKTHQIELWNSDNIYRDPDKITVVKDINES